MKKVPALFAQASLFDPPARPVVELCLVCGCCERVDGVCLGDCHHNGHKIRGRGIQPAPAEGGWVYLERA